MPDRLVVAIEANGWATVSVGVSGETTSSPSEPFNFVWPLDTDSVEELRWYFEDYLRAPYGANIKRAAQVEARMSRLGKCCFRVVFASEQARSAYEAVRKGGANFEVVVQSPAPALLGLPWS